MIKVHRTGDFVMPKQFTEMERKNVQRLSNEDAKKLSQECIETALISLMEHKPFEEITISELVKRAGVSRAAFYRNYETKQDVLLHSFRDAIKEVSASIDAVSYEDHPREFWKGLFSVSASYADSLMLIVKAGFGQFILDAITDQILSKVQSRTTEDRYDMVFWCGAVYNLLVRWISEGCRESVEQMTDIGMYIIKVNFARQ